MPHFSCHDENDSYLVLFHHLDGVIRPHVRFNRRGKLLETNIPAGHSFIDEATRAVLMRIGA